MPRWSGPTPALDPALTYHESDQEPQRTRTPRQKVTNPVQIGCTAPSGREPPDRRSSARGHLQRPPDVPDQRPRPVHGPCPARHRPRRPPSTRAQHQPSHTSTSRHRRHLPSRTARGRRAANGTNREATGGLPPSSTPNTPLGDPVHAPPASPTEPSAPPARTLPSALSQASAPVT